MLSRDTLNTLYKFFPMLIAQLRKQPETARREAGVSATCRGLAADETDAGWFSLLVIPDPALPWQTAGTCASVSGDRQYWPTFPSQLVAEPPTNYLLTTAFWFCQSTTMTLSPTFLFARRSQVDSAELHVQQYLITLTDFLTNPKYVATGEKRSKSFRSHLVHRTSVTSAYLARDQPKK